MKIWRLIPQELYMQPSLPSQLWDSCHTVLLFSVCVMFRRMIEESGRSSSTMADRRLLFAEMRMYFTVLVQANEIHFCWKAWGRCASMQWGCILLLFKYFLIIIHKILISNKYCCFKLSIHRRILKKNYRFPQEF